MDYNKIRLGKMKEDAPFYTAGENVYLTKHKWECGWYWGFGYIGNKDSHYHFDSLLENCNNGFVTASEIFEKTNIDDATWWLIRDLFTQAYALQKAAEVYRHGGHQTSRKGVTDIIIDDAMATRLNADLEKVLDAVWEIACAAVNKSQVAA